MRLPDCNSNSDTDIYPDCNSDSNAHGGPDSYTVLMRAADSVRQ
jgi:hypothetical protein